MARRRYARRRQGYGTRYRSTRRYTGVYRVPSRYAVTGMARRRYGKRRILNVIRSIAEKKYFETPVKYDSTSATYVNCSDGVIKACTLLQTGSTVNNRIGDKVIGTSLEFRHVAFPINQTKVPTEYSYRITIFIWKDDTTPTLDDIFEPNTTYSGELLKQPALWPYNHDKKVKRKILFDKVMTCMQEQVSDGSGSTTYYALTENVYKPVTTVIPLTKLKGLNEIHYQSGVTTAVNHIYYIILNNVLQSDIDLGIWIPFYHYVITRYNFIDM